MTVNGITIWGVQGEANHAKWGKDSAYTAIATFVDTYSINFCLDKSKTDSFYFTDDNDKKGPSQTIANSKKSFSGALSKSSLTEAQVKTFFDILTAALKQIPSRYNIAAVTGSLQSKGLSMDLIAEVLKENPNATGDKLIELVLKKAGATDAEIEGCLTDAAKAEKELEKVIASTDSSEIQNALDKLQSATGYDIALYQKPIDKASKKIDELKKKAEQEKEEEQTKKICKGISTLSLPDLLKIANKETVNIEGVAYTSAVVQKYLENSKVKDALTTAITNLVKANPSAPEAKALAEKGYVKPGSGEMLYYFNYSGKTYVVFVKEIANGAEKKLVVCFDGDELREDFNQEVIVDASEGKLYIDKKYTAINPELKPIDPKTTPLAIKPEDRKAWEFFQHLTGSSDLKLFMEIWKDRRIERKEIEANHLTVRNAHFNIIDRNMDADAVVDIDSEGVITENEIEDYDAQIKYYAEERLKARKDLSREQRIELAKTLYKKSIRYRNSDRLAGNEAETAIKIEVAGVTGPNADVKALIRSKGYSDNVADLVSKYIGNMRAKNITVNDDDVAAFMVMTAEASRFDENLRTEVFGLPSKTEFDYAFRPKTVTKEKYIKWLKGEDVNESEEEGEEGDTGRSDESKIGKFGKAYAAGQYSKAFNIALKIKDGIRIEQHLNQLFKKVIEDAGQLELAYSIAMKFSGETRWNMLTEIAQKYLDSTEAVTRKKALDIVNQIITETSREKKEFRVKLGQDQVPIEQYRERVETELKMPADLMDLKQKTLPSGRVKDPTEALTTAQDLEKKLVTEKDPEKQAYFKMLIGDIYAALASSPSVTDSQKKLEYYYKAQTAYKDAHKLFIDMKNDSKQNTDDTRIYANTAQRILYKMAYEVAYQTKSLNTVKGKIEIIDAKGKPKKVGAKDAILAMIDLISEDAQIPGKEGELINRNNLKGEIKITWERAKGPGGGGDGAKDPVAP